MRASSAQTSSGLTTSSRAPQPASCSAITLELGRADLDVEAAVAGLAEHREAGGELRPQPGSQPPIDAHDGLGHGAPLLDRLDDRAPRLGEVEVRWAHDGIVGDDDGADPVEAERAQALGGVGDEVPDHALLDEPQRVDHALGLRARPVGVPQADLAPLDDGPLQVVEVGWPGCRRTAPAGGVEHDGRGRRLGVGAERLGQRLDELAQRRLGLGRGGRRRPGDHEQGAGLGRGQPAEVRAGAADQRPAAALAGLRVDRDAGHGQRQEVAAGGLDGHLQLVGDLGGGDAAPGLEHEEGGDEAIGTHAPIVAPEVDRGCLLLARMLVV